MTTKLPYAPSTGANIANLDPFFGPSAPPLPDATPPDDLMQQNPDIHYALAILYDLAVGDRTDVFVDTNSIIYYDPTNRNRRVQPDVYVAFDVDADAILNRNGYVIWEVGKPPDFVLEIASETTAGNDTGRKRDLYERLGVREYWRFDRTGGQLYGAALAGDYLEDGTFRPVHTYTDSEGTVSAHSRLLGLNLRWRDCRLELQIPESGETLTDRRGQRLARIAAEEQRDAAVEERDAAQAALRREQERNRQLEAQLRERRQSE